MVVLVLLMIYLFFIKGYDNSYDDVYEEDTESLSAPGAEKPNK